VEAAAGHRAGDSRGGDRGPVTDERCESVRPGNRAGGSSRSGPGRVLRMASQLAAPDPG
jgi:hypothetical protein